MKLVFTSGEGIAGAVTRWWTWDKVGHVAAEIEPGLFLDATPSRGVAKHCDLAGTIIAEYRVMVPDRTIEEAVWWAAMQAGARYDWSAIYGMPFRRDWHDPRKWFCSELWAAAFEYAGEPLLRATHLDRVTPRDLRMSPLLRPA